MSLFQNKAKTSSNKDLDAGLNLGKCYEMVGDFKSSFNPFHIQDLESPFLHSVIDESVSNPVGYKARAGELLVQRAKEQGYKELVYVQPRQGFAGISLSYLCKMYDLDLTLVMPSSKVVSPHQALCIEYGAKPLFLRVAAMPNANVMAKRYAELSSSRMYIPLGLQHPLVVANGVVEVHNQINQYKPGRMWSVISTGVLQRTLQIALPHTKFSAVAVARNIQEGEIGKAEFYSYHKPFGQKSDRIPKEFNSEPKYDSKGWDVMCEYLEDDNYFAEDNWFFNVAGDAPEPTIDPRDIDSYRDWGDKKDFPISIH